MKPSISVAMCTCNGARFLEEQLDSLLCQTLTPTEILIFDDQSTDGTWEILQDYQQKYPDLIHLKRNSKRLGFQQNFESVLRACHGELIAPCDQDDIWKPEKLEILLGQIKNKDLVYHDSELINQHGEKLHRKISDRFEFLSGGDSLPFLFFNCISGHSMLFRRSLLADVFPIPQAGYYDHWIAYIAVKKGSIGFIKAPLVLHRRHGTNSSGQSGKKKSQQSRFQSAKERILNENRWIEACSRAFPEEENGLLSEFAHLVKKRESNYINPLLSWKMWKNRKRVFALLPKNPIKHFTISLRYFWGLKFKKLLYRG